MHNNINELVNKQRAYFTAGHTRDISFRKNKLERLYDLIKTNEEKILIALKADLNKSFFESYMTEIGIIYREIKFILKNLNNLCAPKKVKSTILNFPSKSYKYYDPYGCVLIISPWNYPFQLAMMPLIGAIAGGNCAIIKPSNYSTATSKVIHELLAEFNDGFISVIEGGRDANSQLLDEKFDLIFFTGSPSVGKLVMEKAAKHLTPVILELGGKSPCIVDKTADLTIAARRIAWGKLVNAGQTCVAPDYLLIHKSIKEEFLEKLKIQIISLYSNNIEKNNDYPKIINIKHYDRLKNLIENTRSSTNKTKDGILFYGGNYNDTSLTISPTIIDDCSFDAVIMQEEIFGPILPVIYYDNIDDIINKINSKMRPLSLYLFTTNDEIEKKVLNTALYGGGCINDCLSHLLNENLSFGGVGESGFGKYHGKNSFYAFTNEKSIEKRYFKFDYKFRYPPYKKKLNLLRKIMK